MKMLLIAFGMLFLEADSSHSSIQNDDDQYSDVDDQLILVLVLGGPTLYINSVHIHTRALIHQYLEGAEFTW